MRKQPEEEENIEHLLCHYPAYNRTRNDPLGKYVLSNHPKICAAVKMVLPMNLLFKVASEPLCQDIKKTTLNTASNLRKIILSLLGFEPTDIAV